MTLQPILQMISELRAQWAGNRRLRWGLIVVVAILAAEGLLELADVTEAWRGKTALLREEVDRNRPLLRDKSWPGRADDARQQLDAARTMLWPAGDAAVVEAAVQDWARGTAAKAGLAIREMTVSRPAAVAAAASVPAGARAEAVRLRLLVDFNRLALMGLLAEVARNEQVVVVDRLVMRPAAQPPIAELELRAMFAPRAEPR